MKNADTAIQKLAEIEQWNTPYEGLSHVAFLPLRHHSPGFHPFSGLADKIMKEKARPTIENSPGQRMCKGSMPSITLTAGSAYDSLWLGITACDGPTERLIFGDKKFLDMREEEPADRIKLLRRRTIAPYGPLSSLPFAPEIVLRRWSMLKDTATNYGKYMDFMIVQPDGRLV